MTDKLDHSIQTVSIQWQSEVSDVYYHIKNISQYIVMLIPIQTHVSRYITMQFPEAILTPTQLCRTIIDPLPNDKIVTLTKLNAFASIFFFFPLCFQFLFSGSLKVGIMW